MFGDTANDYLLCSTLSRDTITDYLRYTILHLAILQARIFSILPIDMLVGGLWISRRSLPAASRLSLPAARRLLLPVASQLSRPWVRRRSRRTVSCWRSRGLVGVLSSNLD
jgi:hypothetical protein